MAVINHCSSEPAADAAGVDDGVLLMMTLVMTICSFCSVNKYLMNDVDVDVVVTAAICSHYLTIASPADGIT